MQQILKTKDTFNTLRTTRTTKITKSTPKNKPIAGRGSLKQVKERLLTPEGNVGSESSTLPAPQTQDPDEFKLSNHSHPLLTAHDFEVGGTLGHGKYGRVYLARHLQTNYVCALKIISKAQCKSEGGEKLIRRELEIHQNLAHRNILKLLSWFHDDNSIYLVLEYAAGGSLYSRLKKQPNGRFDEQTTAQYVAQLGDALRYMHRKNVVHRDIKPENILLGYHSEIKLADFGYSVHSNSGFRSTVCGTLDYLSPEVAVMLMKPGKGQRYYAKAIDQWSLGVLTYELLVGKPPFEMDNSKATQKKIAAFKGKGLKFPRHVSKIARELIKAVSAI